MSKSQANEHIKVLIRIRPLLERENEPTCVKKDSNFIQLTESRCCGNQYEFDSVYDEEANQKDIYQENVPQMMKDVLDGINTTIFAYGITSSGKTHTIIGTKQHPGITPRAMKELFSLVNKSVEKNPQQRHVLHLSYLEIYKERVYDLLTPNESKDLTIREDARGNIFVPGLKEVEIRSVEQFEQVYAMGERTRTVATTKLNERSSRSHAILMIGVKSTEGRIQKTAKLSFIDLAGSENNKISGNTGVRMAESGAILKSLFVLNKCVTSLVNSESRIPYRDSKLTRLLQDSLGGSARSLMIVTIAPGISHANETHNTLKFAAKSCKIIKKNVMKNENTLSTPKEESMEERLEKWREKKSASRDAKRPRPPLRKSNPRNSTDSMNSTTSWMSDTTPSALPLIQEMKQQNDVHAQRIQNLEKCLFEKERKEGVYTAVDFIREAKHAKKRGETDTALWYYHKALSMCPNHEKLQNKINKIENETGMKVEVRKRSRDDDEENTESNEKKRCKLENKLEDVEMGNSEEQVLSILNSGSLHEIMSLHGIGQKRATSIMSHREHTPFKDVRMISEVPGLGNAFAHSFFKMNVSV